MSTINTSAVIGQCGSSDSEPLNLSETIWTDTNGDNFVNDGELKNIKGEVLGAQAQNCYNLLRLFVQPKYQTPQPGPCPAPKPPCTEPTPCPPKCQDEAKAFRHTICKPEYTISYSFSPGFKKDKHPNAQKELEEATKKLECVVKEFTKYFDSPINVSFYTKQYGTDSKPYFDHEIRIAGTIKNGHEYKSQTDTLLRKLDLFVSPEKLRNSFCKLLRL